MSDGYRQSYRVLSSHIRRKKRKKEWALNPSEFILWTPYPRVLRCLSKDVRGSTTHFLTPLLPLALCLSFLAIHWRLRWSWWPIAIVNQTNYICTKAENVCSGYFFLFFFFSFKVQTINMSLLSLNYTFNVKLNWSNQCCSTAATAKAKPHLKCWIVRIPVHPRP